MEFYERLEQLAFYVRSKAIYYEIKHYVKRKESHMRQYFDNGRGIGKTYNLMKISGKYHIPVLEPSVSKQNQCIIKYEKKFGSVIINPYDIWFLRPGSILLIDEQSFLPDEVLKKIKKKNLICIGYTDIPEIDVIKMEKNVMVRKVL